MVVQHNLTAMNSNRMLGVTSSAQAKSTEKLSSGYKINRAADDAAGLSISEKMRKQIRGLTQAFLNAEDGISAVQTAEGALTEVHDMLQRMNELAVKAANGTNSEDDRQYIQDEIDQLVTEIDRVAETTKFNETYLLKGDITAAKEFTAVYATAGADYTYEAAKFTITGEFYANTGNASDATGAEKVTAANAATYFNTDGSLKDGVKLWAAGTGSTAATIDGTTNKVEYSAATATITNPVFDEDGNELDVAGVIAAKVAGDTIYKNAPETTMGAEAVEGTDYSYTEAAKPALYDVNGNKISENGLDAYLDIAEDLAPYIATEQTKVASLDLDLHVGADATQNNQIEMTIETIKAAIQKVSTQRSALGAIQNRLEHTIANLDNVVENTTAAESQIRDTDMATEMVKYSNNNILAQAGQAMLAQANQSNQGVLSLLG